MESDLLKQIEAAGKYPSAGVGLLEGYSSRFGVSSLSETQRFLRDARPNSLEAALFSHNRFHSDFTLELLHDTFNKESFRAIGQERQDEFYQSMKPYIKMAEGIFTNEMDLYDEVGGTVVVDMTISKRESQALKAASNNLNVIPYTANKGQGTTLMHSKLELITREDGTDVGRVHTAPYITEYGTNALEVGAVVSGIAGAGAIISGRAPRLGIVGAIAAPLLMGAGVMLRNTNSSLLDIGLKSNKKDVFYETSNPKFVTELRTYMRSLAEGRELDTSRNRFILGESEAILAMTRDAQRANGIVLSPASWSLAQARDDDGNIISRDNNLDRTHYAILESFENTIVERASDIPILMATSGQVDSSIRNRLQQAGVIVGSNVGTHYNKHLFENIDEKGTDVLYMGTRRFSAQHNREIMIRLTSEDDPAAFAYYKGMLLSDNKFNVSDIEMTQMGYTNKSFIRATTGTTISQLPSFLGASHFYEVAINNAARARVSGHLDWRESLESYTNRPGIATQNYLARAALSGTPSTVPDQVRDYDRALLSPGLGSLINEYTIMAGFGRLYKDEVGALPSIAGAFGAVLDRTLTYYGTFFDYDETRDSMVPVAGVYENALTFASSFVMTTAASMGLYFSIGIPLGYITAELNKSMVQGTIDSAVQKTAGKRYPQHLPILDIAPVDNFELAKYMQEVQGLSGGTLDNYYTNRINTLPALNNLFYRERGATFFEYITKPFILDVMNPYERGSAEDIKLRRSADAFHDSLRRPIGLETTFEERYNPVSGEMEPFLVSLRATNIGFERQRELAILIDEVGASLPAAPWRWGWGEGKEDSRSFVSMAEVFSFSEMAESFHRILGTGSQSLNYIVSSSENNTSGMKGLLMRGGAMLGGVMRSTKARLQGNNLFMGIGPIATTNLAAEYKELMKLERQMLVENLLTWEVGINGQGSRQIGNVQTLEQRQLVAKFVDQLIVYNQAIQSSPHYQQAVQRAAGATAAQEDLFRLISGRNSRFLTSSFFRNKGIIGASVLALMNVQTGLANILDASGPSFLRSINLQFGAVDVEEVRYNNRNLILEGPVMGAAYTALAVAGGYVGSEVFGSMAINRYSLSDELYASGNSRLISAEAEGVLKRGTLVKKGNRFMTWGLTTAALLWAPRVITGVGNFIMNTFNRMTGQEGQVLDENYATVGSLQAWKQSVLNRVNTGGLVGNRTERTLEAWSAFVAGRISAHTPVAAISRRAKTIEVYASQAPTSYIQFFIAESRRRGSEMDKGVYSYSMGVQSAPVLGISMSVSAPLAFDANKPFAEAFIYNQEKDNVINYIQSAGNVSLAVSLTAGLVSLSALLPEYARSKILRDPTIGAGAKDLSNKMTNLAALVDDWGGRAMNVPIAGARTAVGSFWHYSGKVVDTMAGFSYGALQGFDKLDRRLAKVIALSNFIVPPVLGVLFGLTGTSPLTSSLLVGTSLAFAYSFAMKHDPWRKKVAALQSRVARITGMDDIRISRGMHTGLRRWRAYRMPLLLGTIAALFQTKTGWNVSEGMDDNVMTRLATVGLYAGVNAMAVVELGDLGLDPGATIERYRRMRAKVGKMHPLNPLGMWRKLRLTSLERDIRSDFNTVETYLSDYRNNRRGYHSFDLLDEHLKTTHGTAYHNAMNEHGRRPSNFQVRDIIDEASNYRLTDYGENLRTLVDSRDYLKYRNARILGPGGNRLLRSAAALGVVNLAATALLLGVGAVLSGSGNQEEATAGFYNAMDGTPLEFVSNAFRLVTRRDIAVAPDPLEPLVVMADGAYKRKRGVRLINPIESSVGRMSTAIDNLRSSFVLNASNPFMSVLVFGTSVREGELGSRQTFYMQLQSTNQDISTAVYSTAPAYMFKMVKAGAMGQLYARDYRKANITDASMNNLSEDQRKFMAISVVSLTARLDPLTDKNRRRVTSPLNRASLALYRADPLMNIALSSRLQVIRNFAYQRPESLVSEMTNLGNPDGMNPRDSKKPKSYLDTLIASLSKGDMRLLAETAFPGLASRVANPLNFVQYENFIKYSSERRTGGRRVDIYAADGDWLEMGAPRSMRTEESNILGMMGSFLVNFWGKIPLINTPIMTSLAGGVAATMIAGAIGAMMSLFGVLEGGKQARAIDNVMTELRVLWAGERAEHFIITAPQAKSPLGENRMKYEVKRGRFTYTLHASPPDGMGGEVGKRIGYFLNSFMSMTANDEMDTLMARVYDAPIINESTVRNITDRDDLIRKLVDSLDDTISRGSDSFLTKILNLLDSDISINNGPGPFSQKAYSLLGLNEETFKIQYGDADSFLRRRIREVIKETIEREVIRKISLNPGPGDAFMISSRFRGLTSDEQIRIISASVLNELGFLFKDIKEKALIMAGATTDIEVLRSRNQRVEDWANKQGGIIDIERKKAPQWKRIFHWDSGKAPIADPSEIKVYPFFKARLSARGSLQALGGGIMTAWGGIESLDVGSAFIRLGRSQRDELYTEAEKQLLEEHAGMTVRNSITGIVTGLVAAKAIGAIGAAVMGAPLIAAIGVVAIGVGIATGLFAWGYKHLEAVTKGDAWQDFSQASERFWAGVDRAIGDIIGDKIPGVLSLGNNQVKGVITSAIGMALGVMSLVGAAASWFKGAGWSLIAKSGLGGFLGGAAISAVPGVHETLARGSSAAVEGMGKITGLNMFVTPTDYLLARYKQGPGGMTLAMPGRAFQYNADRWAEASKDSAGSRTAAMLLPTPDGGDSNIQLLDPFTEREIARRARLFNVEIFGQTSWVKSARASSDWGSIKVYARQQMLGQYKNNMAAIRATVSDTMNKLAQSATPYSAEVARLAIAVSKTVGGPAPATQSRAIINNNGNFSPELKEIAEEATRRGHIALISQETSAEQNGNTVTVTTRPSDDNSLWVNRLDGKLDREAMLRMG